MAQVQSLAQALAFLTGFTHFLQANGIFVLKRWSQLFSPTSISIFYSLIVMPFSDEYSEPKH
jgi:uncharacterized membrane protein (DUF2068 family)